MRKQVNSNPRKILKYKQIKIKKPLNHRIKRLLKLLKKLNKKKMSNKQKKEILSYPKK
jgi:hypothetical protein